MCIFKWIFARKIYVEQSLSFRNANYAYQGSKLYKALYRLKQAPRDAERFGKFLEQIDKTLFIKTTVKDFFACANLC